VPSALQQSIVTEFDSCGQWISWMLGGWFRIVYTLYSRFGNLRASDFKLLMWAVFTFLVALCPAASTRSLSSWYAKACGIISGNLTWSNARWNVADAECSPNGITFRWNRQFLHNLHCPVFFLTITIGELYGLLDGAIRPFCNRSSTLVLISTYI